MNVYPDNLAKALARKLLPVYLITGDEPLQMMEAADQIRIACREAGFTESERFQVDNVRTFDWQGLTMSGNSMSLFGDRKIINLHLPSGKPGTEGAAVLKKWCENPPDDNVLLITGGRPEGRVQTTAWFKAIDKVGITMQVWPLPADKTRQWIATRLKRVGIAAEPAAIELLTDRVEGNLLAARQEIDKLAILYTDGKVGPNEVLASVTDSSRYTILDLLDAALAGDTRRAIRVLDALRAAGDAPVLICWHLASEVRKITSVIARMEQGENQSQAMMRSGVWKNRQSQIAGVLQKRPRLFWLRAAADCSYLDRLSKGMAGGDLWTEIAAFVVRFSGTRWPMTRASDLGT